MSSPSKSFEEARERDEHARSGDRLVPLFSAIIAVLAALGSLFAHHKSILALDIKNQATHAMIQASDQYAYYQAKRVRIGIYHALLDSGIASSGASRAKLGASVDREERTSLGVLAAARSLEQEAEGLRTRSETELHAFETFEIATTLFEVAIVLASISALTRTRWLLWTGSALSLIGIALVAVAYVQGH